MSEQAKIGLVTVTYNSAGVLEEFMTSLLAQEHKNWLLFAVDNQSKDATLEQLNSYKDPRVRVIANDQNLGVAGGNNQGIQEAIKEGCDHIVLINNDTEFEPNLLSGLLENLNQHKCDMVVPKIYYHDPKDRLWFAGGSFRRFLFWQIRHFGLDETDRGRYDQATAISYAPTCCVLMPSRVFEKVGLMDEQYFVYYDDVDFFLRANRQGYITYYVPQVHLYHKVSSLSGGNESEFGLYMQSRNAILFARKNFDSLRVKLVFIGQQIFFWLRLLLGKDSHKVYTTRQRGFWDGIRMRLEVRSK